MPISPADVTCRCHVPMSPLFAGATDAGDAFCAGVLLALHNEEPLQDALKLGVCAAASSLLHPTASLGVMSKEQCLKLGKEFSFREL